MDIDKSPHKAVATRCCLVHFAVACVELCLDLGLFTFFVCAFSLSDRKEDKEVPGLD